MTFLKQPASELVPRPGRDAFDTVDGVHRGAGGGKGCGGEEELYGYPAGGCAGNACRRHKARELYANSVVIHAIPDDCLVVGAPARVVRTGIQMRDYV